MKLWHTQDWLYGLQRPDVEDTEETWQQLQKLKDLNLQRNRLIEDLDELLSNSIKAGDAPRMRSHKCLGNSTKTA
jgi:hypothetical protein